MSTLELERVGRRYGKAGSERVVLREITLSVHSGELVVIWGLHRSGRTTLMRVSAGIEPVSSGVVRLNGRDLAERGCDALGGEIGCCMPTTRRGEVNGSTLDGLVTGQLARGVQLRPAHARALEVLERTGASAHAASRFDELNGAAQTRVMIARALTSKPSLLVVDDPIRGVDLLERDAILALLRALADDGTAILMSVDIATGLRGADRALSLTDGELHGVVAPTLAEVLPLRRQRSA